MRCLIVFICFCEYCFIIVRNSSERGNIQINYFRPWSKVRPDPSRHALCLVIPLFLRLCVPCRFHIVTNQCQSVINWIFETPYLYHEIGTTMKYFTILSHLYIMARPNISHRYYNWELFGIHVNAIEPNLHGKFVCRSMP